MKVVEEDVKAWAVRYPTKVSGLCMNSLFTKGFIIIGQKNQ